MTGWGWVAVMAACTMVGLLIRFAIDVGRQAWLAMPPRSSKVSAVCPGCGIDLVSRPDTRYEEYDGLTRFSCPCGQVSTWEFRGYDYPVLLATTKPASPKQHTLRRSI